MVGNVARGAVSRGVCFANRDGATFHASGAPPDCAAIRAPAPWTLPPFPHGGHSRARCPPIPSDLTILERQAAAPIQSFWILRRPLNKVAALVMAGSRGTRPCCQSQAARGTCRRQVRQTGQSVYVAFGADETVRRGAAVNKASDRRLESRRTYRPCPMLEQPVRRSMARTL